MDLVYIETTIPSTYFDERTDPKIIARRDWTRAWWDRHRSEFMLVTSDPVLNELAKSDHPFQQEKIDLMKGIDLLPVANEISDIVSIYLNRYVMPNDPFGDALHLALASFHKCDILLTWNCQHLANANKTGHIRRVNTLLGLHVPDIITPMALLGDDY